MDGSGTAQTTYQYDAYGQTTASTGSVRNPFRYTGQYQDRETGLYYLRARYYDPATAQFLTRDPLLAVTGQAYNYVNGSPVNGTDPSGKCGPLTPLCIAIALVLAPLFEVAGAEAIQATAEADSDVIGADVVDLTQTTESLATEVDNVGAASGKCTMYRVEGDPNQRFTIDASGNVSMLSNNNRLYAGFDAEYARYFLAKRIAQELPGANLKSFEVESRFLDMLRSASVPQSLGRVFPNSPQLSDTTVGQDLYGIPSNYFADLLRSIIQGSGRIHYP